MFSKSFECNSGAKKRPRLDVNSGDRTRRRASFGILCSAARPVENLPWALYSKVSKFCEVFMEQLCNKEKLEVGDRFRGWTTLVRIVRYATRPIFRNRSVTGKEYVLGWVVAMVTWGSRHGYRKIFLINNLIN
jgi:hypothetical protein